MAEAARVLDYEKYNCGSAAPAKEVFVEEVPQPLETPDSHQRARQRQNAKAAANAKNAPGVSLFAIVGMVVVSVLMIFVILAQISYNETAAESARLNAQLLTLNEQHRRLEITFESVIDMTEIERYARDVLGMTRPIASGEGVIVIQSTANDRAEVLAPPDQDSLRDFGSFLSSLLSHFR
ncbi:MAG: cell division protein FtsL [Oscillospiraceae bacterium]|nr:cell division protein FtsL [Oscillospiraceae bacterium]